MSEIVIQKRLENVRRLDPGDEMMSTQKSLSNKKHEKQVTIQQAEPRQKFVAWCTIK